MNVTVVLEQDGSIAASMLAHAADHENPQPGPGGVIAIPNLVAEPGQSLREIVVPDDLGSLSGDKLHESLVQYL
jgi:hypothetical protein